jgi:hypothetical protein
MYPWWKWDGCVFSSVLDDFSSLVFCFFLFAAAVLAASFAHAC